MQEKEYTVFKVYHRKTDGKLGMAEVSGHHHHDTIIELQEALVESGTGYNMPVLVLINGGKK